MGIGDITNEIVKLATTHGLSKDVIDLLTTKASLLESENASLKQEKAILETQNDSLKRENNNLQRQIGDHNNDFETIDGILWKRTDAGYEPNPYCPKCHDHPVMMEFPPRSKQMWACPDDHTFAFAKHPKLP